MTSAPRLRAQIGIITGAFVFLAFLAAFFFTRTFSPDSSARAIVSECARLAGDHAPCYESEVPQLYPRLSVSRIFNVIREIRREDPSYQFCHVLAHKVGERVVAEDPTKWVDAIPLNPADGLCSNGYIHGVIGGRFRAEVLTDAMLTTLLPDFKRACEPRDGWDPSELDRAICYHGMGHLYDFITDADLQKALDLCKETTPEDTRRVCIEGVFMQIYQPLEPDDFLLIKQMPVQPSTTTVRQFCSSFRNPDYVGACLRESWPFFRKSIMDGIGVEAFCSGQPSAELEDLCYRSAFTIIGRLSLGKQEAAARACSKSPEIRQGMCYSVIAQSVLEEDRSDAKGALALCARAPEALVQGCREWLVSQAPFVFGSNAQEYRRFCTELPASLQQSCLDSNRTHQLR
ncbi:hypothetical protein HY971_02135 [Candidatus Kaiserbacteria bacterium]|nr:hypothetical protein [Candidatus Kaiserbacteria bacterium]